MPRAQTQYDACPKCKSDNWGIDVDYDSLEQDGDTVWKEYHCVCGFSWREVWVFSHNETCDAECTHLDIDGDAYDDTVIVLEPPVDWQPYN